MCIVDAFSAVDADAADELSERFYAAIFCTGGNVFDSSGKRMV